MSSDSDIEVIEEVSTILHRFIAGYLSFCSCGESGMTDFPGIPDPRQPFTYKLYAYAQHFLKGRKHLVSIRISTLKHKRNPNILGKSNLLKKPCSSF